MKAVSVFFILVIIESHLFLTVETLQDSPGKHVKKKEALVHKLMKRQLCDNPDEYLLIDHCCKRCKAGTYVTSHCNASDRESKCDNCTEGQDYIDQPSGLEKCLKCKICDNRKGLEVLRNCTVTQNTKCRCKRGFFCTSLLADGSCNSCEHCTECKFGYFERCTESKDNVCVSEFRSHVWIIVAFGGLAIVATVIGLLYWKEKRKKRSKKSQIPRGPNERGPLVPPSDPTPSAALPSGSTSPPAPPRPTLPGDLQDMNLENLLYDIASKMEKDEVLKVARKKLPPTDVEETHDVHRENPTEAKYQLLYKWYKENGRQGAFSFLFEQCSNHTREKLLELVGNEQTGL